MQSVCLFPKEEYLATDLARGDAAEHQVIAHFLRATLRLSASDITLVVCTLARHGMSWTSLGGRFLVAIAQRMLRLTSLQTMTRPTPLWTAESG